MNEEQLEQEQQTPVIEIQITDEHLIFREESNSDLLNKFQKIKSKIDLKKTRT